MGGCDERRGRGKKGNGGFFRAEDGEVRREVNGAGAKKVGYF